MTVPGGFAISADAVARIEDGVRRGESYRRIAVHADVSEATARRYAGLYRVREGLSDPVWRGGLGSPALATSVVAEISRLAVAGATVPAIAAATAVSITAARKYARLANPAIVLDPRRPVADPELVAKVERLHARGEWPSAIARHLGIDVTTAAKHVRRYRARVGLAPLAPHRHTQPTIPTTMIQSIEGLAAENKTARDIAAQLGIPLGTAAKYVRAWRVRTGIARVAPSKAQPLTVVEATAFRLVQQGVSRAEAGARLQISEIEVRKACQRVRRQAGTRGHGGVRLSKGKIERIEQLAARGLVAADIADDLGVSLDSVYRYRRAMLHRLGDRAPRCGCGKPVGHVGHCPFTVIRGTGEIEPLIAQMAHDGEAMNDIAIVVGVSEKVVGRIAGPIFGLMRAAGDTCWCGRDIGHRQRCALTRSGRADEIAMMRRHLAKGADIATVAKTAKAPLRIVRQVESLMAGSADGEARSAALRAKAARRTTAKSPAAQQDALYGEIARHVPHHLAADLRDDIIGDIYEAIMSGDFRRQLIKQHAGGYVRAGVARWADGFGHRDIDAPIIAGGSSISELIEDGTALDQIGDIAIGRLV